MIVLETRADRRFVICGELEVGWMIVLETRADSNGLFGVAGLGERFRLAATHSSPCKLYHYFLAREPVLAHRRFKLLVDRRHFKGYKNCSPYMSQGRTPPPEK
jgi:hypothetical protein